MRKKWHEKKKQWNVIQQTKEISKESLVKMWCETNFPRSLFIFSRSHLLFRIQCFSNSLLLFDVWSTNEMSSLLSLTSSFDFYPALVSFVLNQKVTTFLLSVVDVDNFLSIQFHIVFSCCLTTFIWIWYQRQWKNYGKKKRNWNNTFAKNPHKSFIKPLCGCNKKIFVGCVIFCSWFDIVRAFVRSTFAFVQ